MPSDVELNLKIANLEMLIALEEENYITALRSQTGVGIIRRLRTSIRKLKDDLQFLLEQRDDFGQTRM